MNEKLRKFLEANGLRTDATVEEAWARYDELVADGVEVPGVDPGQRAASGSVPTGGDADEPAATRTAADDTHPAPVQDVQAQIDRALAADAERRSEIEGRLRTAGLMEEDNGEFARTLLNNPAFTVERASAEIFKRMQQRTEPLGTGVYGSASVGTESREKLRSAVTDGLSQRCGLQVESPADGAREYRGRSLVGIARDLMEAAGQPVRGLSRTQLVGRALAGGASTSDFPLILAGLVNSHLMQSYNEWPATFRPFVSVGSANDFKELHALKMSEAPDLMDLNERGEYKSAAFSESGESYRVITKGRVVSLTRQMIINDDLRAFTRIPTLFGSAAKRMEADAVYSLITANAPMSDGKALFHADHNNLGSGAALSSTSLGAARAAMRKQKGMQGVNIDVTPAFLLVPVEKELDAEILLRSAALPEDNKSAGVHNPWAGKLTPIADPHLTGNAWYLFAHPNQFPTIEVAYLEGEEQPYIDEELDFDSDALKIKVRHDFGAGVVDHIGGYKNPGA